MAIDPATAKLIAQAVINQITDEEKRQKLIIGIVAGITLIVLLIMLPLFFITETLDNIKSFFGFGEDGQVLDDDYNQIVEMRAENPYLQIGELTFNGQFPMPVNNAVVTCEFGYRIHPVTHKPSFHTGIDLAGAWHSNIMSILDGTVVFAGVQGGYGNCVEIEHIVADETIYTFYGHLARIDVPEGQEVLQGSVIGLQGGDPNRDANARTFYWHTLAF